MAREGIYAGGKEIIQRYVGDRLVWEKVRFELVGTFSCSMVKNEYEKTITVYFRDLDTSDALVNGIYYLKSREHGLKYPFVKTVVKTALSDFVGFLAKLSFEKNSDYVYGYYNWVPAGGTKPQEYIYIDIPFYRKIGG